MSDDQLLRVLDRMDGAPRLVTGRLKLVYIGDGLVVLCHRVGKGERWAFGPRDIRRVTSLQNADCCPSAARWAQIAAASDLSAFLRANAARVL